MAVPSGSLSCPAGCVNLSFSAARERCPASACRISAAAPHPWIWDDQHMCGDVSRSLPLRCAFGAAGDRCVDETHAVRTGGSVNLTRKVDGHCAATYEESVRR